MQFSSYPDGVRGTESVFSSIDSTVILATCPAEDCDFDGDAEADVFLLAAGREERTFEYHWACPDCGIEVVEERTYRDGEDS